MKKKYFTEEEKKEARKLESKKYYQKIKKQPLSDAEKWIIKQERLAKREKYIKEYYINNKDKILSYSKEYFKDNKEEKQKKNNDRYNKRREVDAVFKLTTNIRRNLRGILKRFSFTKKCKSYEILGCSFEIFKQHLETQFESWMNWNNYGLYNGEVNYGWDIDHIIPISTAKTEEDVINLNHYTNLQPLCSYNNRVLKRDNIISIKKINNISTISTK